MYSVAIGFGFPGVGPEHSILMTWAKVTYDHINDTEAVDAVYELSRLEGIILALDSAHAVLRMLLRRQKRILRVQFE